MAEQKKFGTIAGVFTPSILTILGVIMYLRLGWVVGNAGLIGTIIIIAIAHIISVSTGLSVSSIATDKKVGAGGIYYILSRSMGFPIGGAIGITLYVGTALSIALYLIGFAESFNGYFGLATDINGLRIGGTIALVGLTIIALISTSFALKAQFFIVAAIIISLLSIFLGTSDFAPASVQMFSDTSSVPLEVVFAIFFPAVTGFTAGIALSGDLKNPKRSIPVGTIASIGVGLVVYIGLAIFLSFSVDSETLKTDYNILMKIAVFAPAVVAGIWGATLSSALGGILGGPRILQAMSLDRVTPKIFGKGNGKNNEPINALILVFVLAQAGILIGELDVIARVVSMFYLSAYGFINLSFFLESWANPDFQPSFKASRWIGLVGALACFGVMFKLDMIAMFASFIILGGVYFWLYRKKIQHQYGDVWQSVWQSIVSKGLKKLDGKDTDNEHWNPNILLFSGNSLQRPHLLEFGKIVSGQNGIVTNFNLIANNLTSSKKIQTVQEQVFDDLKIFGKSLDVENVYDGIENIALTYGFSGIEPNTIMIGWGANTSDPVKYAKLTHKLVSLDYNLLYLDYDKKLGFGKYQTIDLWWRAQSNNAEMMVNIARFMKQSSEWAKCKVRVLFVNQDNSDNSIIIASINKLLEKYRLDAEIKIINNYVAQKSIHEVIQLQSMNTDLVVLGIPVFSTSQYHTFIENTSKLFDSIGTTLLVRASNNFNELSIDYIDEKLIRTNEIEELRPLRTSTYEEVNDFVVQLDSHLLDTVKQFKVPAFSSIASIYIQFLEKIKKEYESTLANIIDTNTISINSEIQKLLKKIIVFSQEIKENKLADNYEFLDMGIQKLLGIREMYIQNSPNKIKIPLINSEDKTFLKKYRTINSHKILDYATAKISLNTKDILNKFSIQNYIFIKRFTDDIIVCVNDFIKNIKTNNENAIQVFNTDITELFGLVEKDIILLESQVANSMSNFEREICNDLIDEMENPNVNSNIKVLLYKEIKHKNIKKCNYYIKYFAKDWQKNQELFHNELETILYLSVSGYYITMVNENLTDYINKVLLLPQETKMKLLNDVIHSFAENYQEVIDSKFDVHGFNDLTGEYAPLHLDNILKTKEEEIMYVLHSSEFETEIILQDSINNFTNRISTELESVHVDLTKIQDYIIQTCYLSPMEIAMQEFEVRINSIREDLYNFANLIVYQIEDAKKFNDKHHILNTINEIIDKSKVLSNRIETSMNVFEDETGNISQNTITKLNFKFLNSSVESLSQFAQKPMTKRGLKNWSSKKKNKGAKFYRRAVDFLVKGKENIDMIKFDEENYDYVNIINRVSSFFKENKMETAVEEKLTYYYKKLFNGAHLGDADNLSRKHGIKSADDAILRIQNGVSGAIMVIGGSLSGKTFFTETVAKKISGGNRFIINPPNQQNLDVNDLHIAFQNIFNKKGTTQNILDQIDSKSILIFNNIEKWWSRSRDGQKVINYLSKLVGNYGNKHYFLLNCNIHSYDVLRKVSSIESSLLATIVIPPVSKTELAEIILKRHKVAGDEILYNKKRISDLKTNDKLFNEIHLKSNGNIGIALNIWLNSISINENDELTLTEINKTPFPKINNSNWKVILYNFILHKHLTERHLRLLFDKKDNAWIKETLQEMEKAELIYKSNNGIYILNKVAKYYIENQLIELNILN